MGVEEVPKSYLYTCDACGLKHTQENANGHYTDSRPPHWAWLKIFRSAYEGDVALADASIKRLLCEPCTDKAVKAINAALPR